MPKPRATLEAWLRRLLVVPGDTDVLAAQKTAWFVGIVVALLFGLQGIIYRWQEAELLRRAAVLILAGVSTILLAILLYTKHLSTYFIGAATIMMCIAFTLTDIRAMTSGIRRWQLFVCLVDLHLLGGAPRAMRYATAIFISLWIVFTSFESAYRFMDIAEPWLKPYDERVTYCDKPPCPTNDVLLELLVPLCVFLFDLYATTNFAEAAQQERQRVEAAVTCARQVAGRLAEFDLPGAQADLARDGAVLPAPLEEAFHTLLNNLESYRPYLPNEFFNRNVSDAGSGDTRTTMALERSSIPGMLEGEAVIAFTDIRQSTVLWELSHDSMVHALRVHNRIVRRAIAACGGYEVKTIGDAFMVAFHSPPLAVRWGLQVQEDIAEAAENEMQGLMRPDAKTDGNPVFCCRIGIHVGETVIERNVLTGRFDYFGTTVNTAARVEACGVPGTVTVTATVRAAAAEVISEEDAVEVAYPEATEVRGLSDALQLWALIPEALMERQKHVQVQCAERGALAAAVAAAEEEEEEGVRVAVAVAGAESGGGGRGGVVRPPTAGTILFVQQDVGSPTSVVPMSVAPSVRARRVPSAFEVVSMARRLTACSFVHGAACQVGFDLGWDDELMIAADMEEMAALRLQAVDRCLRETCGHLATAVNNLVLASWNVQRTCRQYVNQSARFVRKLPEYVPSAGAGATPFVAGLATGSLALGELGASQEQRFVTLLGPSVDLVADLRAGAAARRVAVLVGCVHDVVECDNHLVNPHSRQFLRLVDVLPKECEKWGGRLKRGVYELDIEAMGGSAPDDGGGLPRCGTFGDLTAVLSVGSGVSPLVTHEAAPLNVPSTADLGHATPLRDAKESSRSVFEDCA